MNCEQLREHYELYALGIAEQPERGEIRDHLDRGCEVCGGGVKRALETVSLFGASAPPAQPSAKLRRRILASVGVEQRGPGWLGFGALTAAFSVIVVFLLFVVVNRTRYVDEALRSRQALSILYGPGLVKASFRGTQTQPPEGAVFVSPSRGVLLIASNLPPTPADKIYEMWLIPKGAKPIPAGLFQAFQDRDALYVHPGPVDLASTAAVAVTLENAAGADQPTTTPLIVASLPAL
jgi:anti-sigma-K factor RskA